MGNHPAVPRVLFQWLTALAAINNCTLFLASASSQWILFCLFLLGNNQPCVLLDIPPTSRYWRVVTMSWRASKLVDWPFFSASEGLSSALHSPVWARVEFRPWCNMHQLKVKLPLPDLPLPDLHLAHGVQRMLNCCTLDVDGMGRKPHLDMEYECLHVSLE